MEEPSLPDTPIAPPLASPEEELSPAARGLCARVRARNAARLRTRAGWSHLHASQWCLATPAGAWAMAVEGLSVARESGVVGPQSTVRLRWIPAEGEVLSAAQAMPILDAGDYYDEATAAAIFDWDGDGLPELALLHTRHRTEQDHATTWAIVTARGGRIAPYAAAPPEVQRVADFDGDGRPDLELPPGLGAAMTCDGVVEHDGPARVALSLPDGTFSEDHPAARAFVRRQCRGFGDDGTLLSPDDGRSAMGVACALYRGVPAQWVTARVRSEYPVRNADAGDDESARSRDECFALEGLLRLARATVPFTLSPLCPAH